MKKRRARRKDKVEKEEGAFSLGEEQFINLIARILVDITFKQAKNQSNKLSKVPQKDSGRDSKPDKK
ncbi:hypothetical protein [Pedobacter ghigonis]|uniref:hypothetical protein n=1 Tax=Pedobacter ghigonis TaxID=2730403 RepID=UPI00158902ED|nr:hypothetical protein [Pedobacter ghigonis]